MHDRIPPWFRLFLSSNFKLGSSFSDSLGSSVVPWFRVSLFHSPCFAPGAWTHGSVILSLIFHDQFDLITAPFPSSVSLFLDSVVHGLSLFRVSRVFPPGLYIKFYVS